VFIEKTKTKKRKKKRARRSSERVNAFEPETNDDEPPLDSHAIPNLAPLSETVAIARVSFTAAAAAAAATRATTERNDDDDNFFVELLFGGHQRVCNGARIYVSDFESIRAMFATTDGNTREKRGGKESGD